MTTVQRFPQEAVPASDSSPSIIHAESGPGCMQYIDARTGWMVTAGDYLVGHFACKDTARAALEAAAKTASARRPKEAGADFFKRRRRRPVVRLGHAHVKGRRG